MMIEVNVSLTGWHHTANASIILTGFGIRSLLVRGQSVEHLSTKLHSPSKLTKQHCNSGYSRVLRQREPLVAARPAASRSHLLRRRSGGHVKATP